VIATANVTMQFGAKPLFENISVKFGDGNRYGLIGANGCGKSTFMKILDGSLAPRAGNVSITPDERLSKLMMLEPNLLILDEPTNHLDMEAIEVLNTALEQYPGTLIFVSHDREFVSSLATRIIETRDRKLLDFKGTYEEYLASQLAMGKAANG